MDDQQAIARLKRGDISGLGALVERYQVRAVRTAYLITQDASLAQDVVQEAFLSAYRGIGKFDARRPFAPWFMRAVVNGAIKATRRGRYELLPDDADEETDDSFIDDALSPDDAVEAAALEQAVWEAMAALPPERRAVIVLKFYLELSEAEMAEQLEIPAGTVKSRLHAAKKQLRTLLDVRANPRGR
jgi:RNA polymerase sigma-70 factor (ECF subfamily)